MDPLNLTTESGLSADGAQAFAPQCFSLGVAGGRCDASPTTGQLPRVEVNDWGQWANGAKFINLPRGSKITRNFPPLPLFGCRVFFGEVTCEGETQNYGPAARALEGRSEWRD